MGIFAKKLKNSALNEKEKSQYEREIEERGPNLKSYEDDPLLNMEPTFVDSMSNNANKVSKKENATATESSTKIKTAIANNMAKKQQIVSGPLGNIIGNARKQSEKIANEVIENDPVIAKLKKIDDLLRKGGTDQSLYTDVNKSQVGYYAQRAKEFAEQNTSKKLMSDEERLTKLAEDTKNRGVNNYKPNVSDYTESIKQRVNSSRNVEPTEIFPNEIKKRSMELINKSLQETSKSKKNNSERSIFKSPHESSDFNNEKHYTDLEIKRLEAQIKDKMSKIKKYRESLIKKEEKVFSLIAQSNDNVQSQKIAKFLEAKTVELESNVKILEKQENELEKTIAELNQLILPRRLKK